MQPTAPVPLTRAAARSATADVVERSRDRGGIARALAMTGGAFVGAWIVLGISSLTGISSPEPMSPQSETVQVVAPAPRLPTIAPTPSRTPSADPTLPPVEAGAVAPAPPTPVTPQPAPSQTTAPAPDVTAVDSGPGKSDSAPGRNKPPKP